MRIALATLVSAAFCASAFADDLTYRKNIRPLVKDQCEACHGAQSPTLAEFLADEAK